MNQSLSTTTNDTSMMKNLPKRMISDSYPAIVPLDPNCAKFSCGYMNPLLFDFNQLNQQQKKSFSFTNKESFEIKF